VITFDFSGKAVLVTGSSSGIGFAIARAFLESGANVMINSHDDAALGRALDAIGPLRRSAAGATADVRRKTDVDRMVKAVLDRWGRLDVLVNNAGIYPSVPLIDMSEAQWDEVLDTNLKGAFLASAAAARQMIAQGEGGKIVNIASGSWRIARAGSGAYCASKAGLVMLTTVLAQEMGSHRINVNAVAPGLIDVHWDRPSRETRAYHDATVSQTPLGRMGAPADVANAVLMLCSAETAYVTGAVLSVDGGLSAGRYGIPVSR
jgi:3-oxoacyl-[acyl-carrier protein] reductase